MRKLQIFFTIMLMTVLTGCVTNNGDIGPWYGNWAMTAMTVDGREYTAWQDDGDQTVWSFQNNIVCIQNIDVHHGVDRCWGTWTDNGTVLALDYRQHDNAEPDPSHSYRYTAPAWLLMDANTVITLTIEKSTSKTAVLSYTNAAGQHIIYTLHKNY